MLSVRQPVQESQQMVETAPVIPECPLDVPEQESQEVALLRAQLQERDARLERQMQELIDAKVELKTNQAQQSGVQKVVEDFEQKAKDLDRQNKID